MKSGSLSAGWWYLIRVHRFKPTLPMCMLASSGQETARLIGQQAQKEYSAASKKDYTFGQWRPIGLILFLSFCKLNPSVCWAVLPSAEDLIPVLRSRTWIFRNAMFQSPRAESHVNESERRRALSVEVSGSYLPISETPLGVTIKKLRSPVVRQHEPVFLRISKYLKHQWQAPCALCHQYS